MEIKNSNPKIKGSKNSKIENPSMELEINQINGSIDSNEENPMIDKIIKEMENPSSEIKEEIKKIKKIRSYNNPLFKSEDLNDLSSIQFPLIFQKMNEKGEMIEEKFENRFGNLQKGDIFNFRLNPNNRNRNPIGKILHFRIQSNGFWIKYISIDGLRYWKNLNLFESLSDQSQIEYFNSEFKKIQDSKLEKSEK